MKCVLLLATVFAILLLTVRCCSYNQYEIISLMARDPDYQRNPCYIQWKADQDAKLDELFRYRDELEKTIAKNYRIEYENRKRERENRQSRYRSTEVENKKVSTGLIIGIIGSIFVGICCCLGCILIAQNEDNPNTNTLPSNRNPTASAFTVLSTAPEVANNARSYQTTLDHSSTTNPNANLTVLGMARTGSPSSSRGSTPQQVGQTSQWQQSEINVPLLPRGVIKRQDSLPSYEDATRMPSAPPKE